MDKKFLLGESFDKEGECAILDSKSPENKEDISIQDAQHNPRIICQRCRHHIPFDSLILEV